MTYELHPLCNQYPRLAGAAYDQFKRDIAANGQMQPIILLDGLILDGGNRYRALLELGITPIFEEYTGNNPEQFVKSANAHRRHLTPAQYAAMVSAGQDLNAAQSVGRPKKSGNVTGLNTVEGRAALSGASEKTQRNTDKLARKSPELLQDVIDGTKTLAEALNAAQLAEDRAALVKCFWEYLHSRLATGAAQDFDGWRAGVEPLTLVEPDGTVWTMSQLVVSLLSDDDLSEVVSKCKAERRYTPGIGFSAVDLSLMDWYAIEAIHPKINEELMLIYEVRAAKKEQLQSDEKYRESF